MYRKSLDDLVNEKEEKIIIDLRKKEDYRKDTYPGAINIDYDEFYKYLSLLPKDRRIYLFCYTGVSADEIAEDLSGKGYDIYSIEEGYRAVVKMNVRKYLAM